MRLTIAFTPGLPKAICLLSILLSLATGCERERLNSPSSDLTDGTCCSVTEELEAEECWPARSDKMCYANDAPSRRKNPASQVTPKLPAVGPYGLSTGEADIREFTHDSDPPCHKGEFFIYFDGPRNRPWKCFNGRLSDLGVMLDENGNPLKWSPE